VGVVWARCGRRPHSNQELARTSAVGVPLLLSVRGEQIFLAREQVDDLAAAASRADSQACSRVRFTGGEPCRCTVGTRLPVARRRARYRSTEVTDTANRSAARC
jgi:hypothetical protein